MRTHDGAKCTCHGSASSEAAPPARGAERVRAGAAGHHGDRPALARCSRRRLHASQPGPCQDASHDRDHPHRASRTRPASRLQRDLTDSTTQRNVGVALGHSLLAVDNIRRGLAGLDVDRARLEEDLEATWEVLGEPVQQAMRAAAVAGARGMADPYERLKELTRGKKVTPEGMREFISGLGMPDDVEARLLALTPATYTGLAAELVSHLDD